MKPELVHVVYWSLNHWKIDKNLTVLKEKDHEAAWTFQDMFMLYLHLFETWELSNIRGYCPSEIAVPQYSAKYVKYRQVHYNVIDHIYTN